MSVVLSAIFWLKIALLINSVAICFLFFDFGASEEIDNGKKIINIDPGGKGLIFVKTQTLATAADHVVVKYG